MEISIGFYDEKNFNFLIQLFYFNDKFLSLKFMLKKFQEIFESVIS